MPAETPDKLLISWFDKITSLKAGKKLYIPAEDKYTAVYLRRGLFNQKKEYSKICPEDASAISISKEYVDEGKYMIEIKRLPINQTKAYVEDDLGVVRPIVIRPDIEQSIRNMLNDGFKTEKIKTILKLTKEEEEYYF